MGMNEFLNVGFPYSNRRSIRSIGRKCVIPWILLSALTLGGCDVQQMVKEEIDKTRDELTKQIAETRKTFAQVSQDAIKAVPGERYLQLIDDLNSSDPAKKKEAQRFLLSLAHVDLSVPYRATVWFDHIPANEHVTVAVFRAMTPDFAEIQARLAPGGGVHIQRYELNGPAAAGRSLADAKEVLFQKINTAVDRLFGRPEIFEEDLGTTTGNILGRDFTITSVQRSLLLNSKLLPQRAPKRFTNLDPRGSNDRDELQRRIDNAVSQRSSLVRDLANTLIEPYESLLPSSNLPIEELDWDVMDGRQFLFVIMKKVEFDKLASQNPPLRIKAVVHHEDDVHATFRSSEPLPFDLNEFVPTDKHPGFKFGLPNEPEVYVWAAKNMTDFQGYDPETRDKVRALAAKLDEWAKLSEPKK